MRRVPYQFNSFVDAAMSDWYFCKNGKQEGPISLDELKGMIASGELADTLPVWRIGASHWIKIRRHPDLISSIPTPPPLPGPSGIESPRPKALLASVFAAIRGGATS